jgi:hypothetical protein
MSVEAARRECHCVEGMSHALWHQAADWSVAWLFRFSEGGSHWHDDCSERSDIDIRLFLLLFSLPRSALGQSRFIAAPLW